MADTDAVKTLVMRYFDSWPNQKWDQMRSCLADTVEFDAGSAAFAQDADAFTRACAEGAAWRDVKLIQSVFAPEQAALLYEGTDSRSGQRMRVGEFLTLAGGRIRKIQPAIAPLS